MKKIVAVTLAFVLAFSMLGCAEKTDKKSEGVMTYAEYVAAAVDSVVTVETYVQANQSWWDGSITLYTEDKDGGYFVYNLPVSETDAKKLTKGTKIKVTGTKAEWKGEVEIINATYEIEKGNYVAKAQDVTSELGKDTLINYQNRFVSFKSCEIVASKDADGKEVPFLYKWDGSGAAGQNDDLCFSVKVNGNVYSFTVESYLCSEGSDVYTAVTNFKIGEKYDMEGFLYWYNGANPHITSVKKVG